MYFTAESSWRLVSKVSHNLALRHAHPIRPCACPPTLFRYYTKPGHTGLAGPRPKTQQTQGKGQFRQNSDLRNDHMPMRDRMRMMGTTITTTNPELTLKQSTEIERFIDPLPASYNLPRKPVFTLLLTPSFAHWLTGDNVFVRNVIRKLLAERLERENFPPHLDVVAAVVDRLPLPPNEKDSAEGREGIAYSISDAKRMQFLIAEDQSPVGEAETALSTLTVRVTGLGHAIAEQRVEGSHKSPKNVVIGIDIPLANTIFHTGQKHTFFLLNFASNPDFPDIDRFEDNLKLTRKIPLQAASVPYNFSGLDRGMPGSLSLNACLMSLTSPQRVHAAYGNIVRQLSDPEDEANITPASQQLEHAVSEHFQRSTIDPHPVSVWALLIPAKLSKEWEHGKKKLQQQQTEPNDSRREILYAIANGGQLLKVLSGGGGWGKKAGLLSLDPETSFSKPDHVGSEGDYESKHEFSFPILSSHAAAHVGDLLQFFIFQEDHGHHSESSEASDVGRERAHIRRYSGFFGALSERGVELVVHICSEEIARTKVDVPGSRLTASFLSGTQGGVTRNQAGSGACISSAVPEKSDNSALDPIGGAISPASPQGKQFEEMRTRVMEGMFQRMRHFRVKKHGVSEVPTPERRSAKQIMIGGAPTHHRSTKIKYFTVQSPYIRRVYRDRAILQQARKIFDRDSENGDAAYVPFPPIEAADSDGDPKIAFRIRRTSQSVHKISPDPSTPLTNKGLIPSQPSGAARPLIKRVYSVRPRMMQRAKSKRPAKANIRYYIPTYRRIKSDDGYLARLRRARGGRIRQVQSPPARLHRPFETCARSRLVREVKYTPNRDPQLWDLANSVSALLRGF
ncbi:hypothetical protein NA57DRAFT_52029 [Rhizodiscina lignyota]|uniref:V-type c subunit family protein n=1 Tax=Rhizodiscina lignyota TaxID=1504668 RepID=A0A9P4IQL4_9PEZI|nr:hypothetical protein NA57DRAFT_52029 [Rhizodiscina lignyota]